jgi:AraC family transcriptional regulator
MSPTTIHIRNMVCNRCIEVVANELNGLGYTITSLELGEATLKEQVDEAGMDLIRRTLAGHGFELIDDRKGQLINRIKTLIIGYIHLDKEKPAHMNLSQYLSREIGHDYSYLSNLFSSVEGITIEKYMIRQKVEKVKELLVYDELSLSEISYRLGYSSVQHLSQQFKKVTGLTPSHFRKIGENKRKPLDQV